MNANQTWGDGVALVKPGTLNVATKGEIFDNFHAERVKTPDLLVHRGANEVERANTYGVAEGFGIGDSPWTYGQEPQNVKISEKHTFACGFMEGGGENNHVVGPSGDRMSECEAQGVGTKENVGVSKEKIIGLVYGYGVTSGVGHGIGFAEPTGGEFCDMKDAELARVLESQSVHDSAGCIGGAIIDGDDVEAGVLLVDE
jgi:hypothetical protein